MTGTLRVLLVEDSENDAMLLLRELRRGGYEPLSQRVCTPEDMEEALRSADARDELFQVVISDYYMPRFRAPDALRLPGPWLRCPFHRRLRQDRGGRGGGDHEGRGQRLPDQGEHEQAVPRHRARAQGGGGEEDRERAEKELVRSEDRFRHLVEQIPAVTYVQEPIDSDTPKAITYMSPQYEAMLGYPRDRDTRRGALAQVLHPDDRERVLAEELRTDETGEPYRIEYRQIARDGRVVWVRDEATLIRDEEGNSCTGSASSTTSPSRSGPRRSSGRAKNASGQPSSRPPSGSCRSGWMADGSGSTTSSATS